MPPGILKRWSISELNEDIEDRRVIGEVAPLRVCEGCRGRGVEPPVLGLVAMALDLIDGVWGRFL